MVLKRGDMVFAVGVGMISGWWIFGIPLRDAARRQQLQQASQAQAGLESLDAELKATLAAAQEPVPVAPAAAAAAAAAAGVRHKAATVGPSSGGPSTKS
ncbi:hypothetical protein HYH02_007221 [Chlamydomonas schloesseri]|uniref:Uncharacterized protein n=1 Tax=Chlamydomonas schloesseri TaxID=2026947 RepID=A0A835WHR7_9CHLO|nr:hypothetical protein HYH02_007221 [Chlamydomonas schloesseri]|eukprot:KAG2447763.1 hypothetical protein HYH02_007221 [Chlamydomonas schloesseri]